MTFSPGPEAGRADPHARAGRRAALAARPPRRCRIVAEAVRPAAPRARRPHAADRLLRRAVHAGRLPRRRARARKGSAAVKTLLLPRAGDARAPAREARRRDDRLPARCRSRRRAGRADLRLVGGPAWRPTTTSASRCRGCARSSRACADLGVPVIYFVNGGAAPARSAPPRPAPTCSASAGARRSTRPPRASGRTWRSRAISIRTCCSPIPPTVRRARRRRADPGGRTRRPHHEPRARHPAGDADRQRRGAGRGRPRHRGRPPSGRGGRRHDT